MDDGVEDLVGILFIICQVGGMEVGTGMETCCRVSLGTVEIGDEGARGVGPDDNMSSTELIEALSDVARGNVGSSTISGVAPPVGAKSFSSSLSSS